MTQIETERDMKSTMRIALWQGDYAIDAYQGGLISKSLLLALLAAELYSEGYRKEGTP